MFALGYITGLITALLFLVIDMYLSKNLKGAVRSLEQTIDQKTRQSGAIIMPIPDAVRSVQRKIEENEKRGLDTKIDDIL